MNLGFREFELDLFKKMIDNYEFEFLSKLCLKDPETKEFYRWIESHPDISSEEIDEQIIELDKLSIMSRGYEEYLKEEKELNKMLNVFVRF